MTDADKDDDDGKGFFDDSDDDGDNEKAPTKAVSKRERIEALQKKKRAAIPAENKKIKSRQQQPIADAGTTLKDKGATNPRTPTIATALIFSEPRKIMTLSIWTAMMKMQSTKFRAAF
jgi:hypothetical protein